MKPLPLTRIFSLAAMLMAVPQAEAKAADQMRQLFGFQESLTVLTIPAWDEVKQRLKQEKPFYRRCVDNLSSCPTAKAKEWAAMVNGLWGQPRQIKLITVNNFFNQVAYTVDHDLFGDSDYWQTPFEFMAFTGDCEDYAIAKYYTLRVLGFDADSLRIVVLDIKDEDQDHAVLAYLPKAGDALILDNRIPGRLAEERTLSKYKAYHSVNENDVWQYSVPVSPPVLAKN